MVNGPTKYCVPQRVKMTNSFHYSLRDSDYKNSIFTGLSQFQKNEEFVDLTLAADGCFIKVHKNLIALVSPYLKSILKSMPGQSPVIYLNNVHEKELTYLLEYIYRGEVTVPVKSIDAFIQLSKSLHIIGIQDIVLPERRLKLPPLTHKPPGVNIEKTGESVAGLITFNNQLETNQSDDGIQTDHNYEYELKIDHQYSEQTNIQSDFRNLINVETYQNRNPLVDKAKGDNEKPELQIADNRTQIQLDRTLIDCDTDTERLQSIPMLANINNSELDTDTNTVEFKVIVPAQNDSTNNTTTESSQNNMRVLEIVPMRKTGANVQKTSYQDQFASFSNPIVVNQNSTVQQNQIALLQNHMPEIEIMQMNINQDAFTNTLETDVDMTQLDATQDENNGTHINNPGPVEIKFISKNPGITREESSIEETSNTLLVPSALNAKEPVDEILMKDLAHMSQFSITERGAIQLILNRFIYCCHHKSRRRRRWRCIEYRKGKCPASVDTMGDAIIARKGIHAHPYHDGKIYKKHRNGIIFQTIELAETASIEKNSATIN